ncbi:MAG: hypothetical protein IJ744_09260 [Lachnospiraceae bacterium]|nr:hypothetical protein [Lachnospiraceae bacterium]
MWKQIKTQEDIDIFMNLTKHFHDSCLKELCYVSGAYVDEELSMFPVNDQRSLKVIFQLQNDACPMVELWFKKTSILKLLPQNEAYTCEILEASLIERNNEYIWADGANFIPEEIESYSGTIIACAELFWRPIHNSMGSKPVYLGDFTL